MNLRRPLAIVLSLSLALVATVSTVAAQDIERRPVEDEMFGLSSVVPADWQDLGGGAYARGTPPQDEGMTQLVLLQSDPGEFAVLREQVLLPAIDAFAPLEPEPTPDPATFSYQIEEVSFPAGPPMSSWPAR